LAPIQIHATPPHLPVFISQTILHYFHESALRRTDVLKTNQIPGSEIAIWAKKKYGPKLIVRCGYLYSRFMARHTTNGWRIRRAYALEKEAFSVADAGVVTSERDRQWVIETHHVDPEKIHIIPNYVVTDVFKPMAKVTKQYDLVCVAKASPQKNLEALLGAMYHLKQHGMAVSLLLIGTAAKDAMLRRRVQEFQLNVSFMDRVANFDLPAYLNQARVFVLPSLYEGHPKTLLEAMSCGLPCIGTDVDGVREDLKHLKNGYLCQTDSVSLAEAIQMVLDNTHLQQELGKNARQYVIDNYSLKTVMNLELILIHEIFKKGLSKR
jgi:glycosyltransferase involved in cell wall biosynthesis